METKPKFNLLKYVYGRLYAGTFSKNVITEDKKKIWSWLRPMNWLKKEGYIYSFKIVYVNDKAKISYVFNHSKTMYEYYLRAIKRATEALAVIPTGEYVYNREISDFEQERLDQLSAPVERISREDRVRRTMTYSEIYGE